MAEQPEVLNLSAEEIRQRFLEANDLPRKPVTVGSLSFFLQGLSSEEMRDFQRKHLKVRPGEKEPTLDFHGTAAEDLLIAGAVDAHGNKIFRPEDVKALGKKHSAVVQRLGLDVLNLSGTSDEAVEAEAKNSNSSTGNDS